jgi:fatty acid desaturase
MTSGGLELQVTAEREGGRRPPLDTGFGAMFMEVTAAGLMNRRVGYYQLKILSTLALLAAGWAALIMLGRSWTALVAAVVLGFAFTQVVFLGHDSGHHQIFSSRRSNWWLGLLVGNLLTGLSFGWWVPKHSAHHVHPNQRERDPDIAGGVVAFTADNARRRRGISAWTARHQAVLLFPLLLLEALGLHVASLRSLYSRRSERSAKGEVALLVLHAALYFAVIFWVLKPLQAVAFIAVNQAVFGFYLGCSFAPNHKGMPIIDRDSKMSFDRRQVLTARNVTGGRFVTFMLGGLNYQIEHHLFPTMPRPNLARVQPFVRAFCSSNGLPYSEDTLIGSYRQSLRHLGAIGHGAAGDPPVPGAIGFPTPGSTGALRSRE